MSDDMKNIISLLAIVVVVFLLGRCSAINSSNDDRTSLMLGQMAKRIDYLTKELDSRIITNVKTDTIVREKIMHRRIVQWRDSVRVVYYGDSIYTTQSFVARVDTVLNSCDTLNVSYTYPQNTLSLLLRQCPDTIRTITVSTIQYRTKIEKRPLWLDVLSHIGALGAGLGIGYIIGR